MAHSLGEFVRLTRKGEMHNGSCSLFFFCSYRYPDAKDIYPCIFKLNELGKVRQQDLDPDFDYIF